MLCVDNPFYQAVYIERAKQDAKWGGPQHDDEHSVDDWAKFIQERANDIRILSEYQERYRIKQKLIEISALAIAALESMDRRFK